MLWKSRSLTIHNIQYKNQVTERKQYLAGKGEKPHFFSQERPAQQICKENISFFIDNNTPGEGETTLKNPVSDRLSHTKKIF